MQKFAIIFILKVNILNINRLLNGNRSMLVVLRRLFNYFNSISNNKEWKFSLNLKNIIFVFVCFSIIIFIIDPIVSICKSMDNNLNEEDLRVFIPFIFQAIRFFQNYGFPYQPYDGQIKYMDALYKALQEGKVGILESPTGTVYSNRDPFH